METFDQEADEEENLDLEEEVDDEEEGPSDLALYARGLIIALDMIFGSTDVGK